MKAEYWQKGNAIDYTNGTDATIPAGTVVSLGSRVGIAGTDILPGQLGSVITEGAFIFAKTTSTEVIALGAAVYFDGTGVTTSAETNDTPNVPVGWAIKASTASDANVIVKLDTVPDGTGASSGDIASALADYYTKAEVDALIPADGGDG